MSENVDFESVTEDTVQCFFFTSLSNSHEQFWVKLCERINSTIRMLSKDYIWHRDEFKVYLPIDKQPSNEVPRHLASTTCFADNVEDEWFIVYLILEITKQYQDIVVQIKDNDGDFLLIEAADFLPSWANPDNTENRVFIYNNNVHIISPELINFKTELHLEDALNYVVSTKIQTEAPAIQQAIMKRISHYPERIKQNIHRAIVKLPVDIATLLILKPSLISSLVSSYCNQDMIDARACKNIRFENCITVEVKFTKCLYAMLIHSKPTNNIKYGINETDKRNTLGLKLTCGYEIIMCKLSQDVYSTKEYQKFIKHLIEHGYFKDNIEGSQNYKKLLDKANDFFLNMASPMNSHVCKDISELMSTKEFTEQKHKLNSNCISEADLKDDNEDWLNIKIEDLNDFLNTRYGKKTGLKNEDIITPQTITSELSNFLKQTSNFEGIEPHGLERPEDNDIELDPEEFANSLKKMIHLVSSDNNEIDIEDSDFSDYEDDMNEVENDLDKELSSKLHIAEEHSVQSNKNILLNMMKSMREEKGSSGPSSNILRTIGFNKTDLLDSDDDSN